MPLRTLCPNCHGQRTYRCLACDGTDKKSIANVSIGNCSECGGTGQRRCDICGGMGEVEPEAQREPQEKGPAGQTTSAASRVDRYNGYRAGT
jgi:hypothetical protein